MDSPNLRNLNPEVFPLHVLSASGKVMPTPAIYNTVSTCSICLSLEWLQNQPFTHSRTIQFPSSVPPFWMELPASWSNSNIKFTWGIMDSPILYAHDSIFDNAHYKYMPITPAGTNVVACSSAKAQCLLFSTWSHGLLHWSLTWSLPLSQSILHWHHGRMWCFQSGIFTQKTPFPNVFVHRLPVANCGRHVSHPESPIVLALNL